MRGVKSFLKDISAYYADNKKSIAAHNDHMLIDSCLLYTFVLAFYTLVSVATHKSGMLVTMYFIFDGIHVLLCAVVFLRPAKWKESYAITQTLCAVLEAAILCFFMLEGALDEPTEHSLYIPIAALCVLVVFDHPPLYTLLQLILYTTSFAALSYFNKTPRAATNDMDIAMATVLAAVIIYALLLRLRRQEWHVRKQLEVLSQTDMLTGVYNKATLESLCQRHMDESAGTLIVVDLDAFKGVNDDYGHDAGDEVLKSVGFALRKQFRATDVIGRFGGDEFVVLMGGCDRQDVVRDKLVSLQKEIAGLSFAAPELRITCCVGVAFTQQGDGFHQAFVRADKALYEAKHQGRGSICILTI